MSDARSEHIASLEEKILFGGFDFDLSKGLLLIAKKGWRHDTKATLDWLTRIKQLDIEKAIKSLKEQQGISLVDIIIKHKNHQLALYLLQQKNWHDENSKYKLKQAFPLIKEKVGDKIAYPKNYFAPDIEKIPQTKNKKNKHSKTHKNHEPTKTSLLFFTPEYEVPSQTITDEEKNIYTSNFDDWALNKMMEEFNMNVKDDQSIDDEENVALSALKYAGGPGGK